MKIRNINFDLNKAIGLNENFNYRWALDNRSSILGLGYSFYLEYMEYFCYQVDKYIVEKLEEKAPDLLKDNEFFISQERQHASYHKDFNAFMNKGSFKKDKYHPRVFSFMYGLHKLYYEPLLIALEKGEENALKNAYQEIAIFETRNCISSFVFFDNFFDKGNINIILKKSQNLGILYLLGYHFIEEMEHCHVAINIYERLFDEKLWSEERFQEELFGKRTISDLGGIHAAFYCAHALDQFYSYEDFLNSPYEKNTADLQKKMMYVHFHPEDDLINDRRAYFINKWDKEWEIKLREEILKHG